MKGPFYLHLELPIRLKKSSNVQLYASKNIYIFIETKVKIRQQLRNTYLY